MRSKSTELNLFFSFFNPFQGSSSFIHTHSSFTELSCHVYAAEGTPEEAGFVLVMAQTSKNNNGVCNFASVQNEECEQLTHKFVCCYC